MTPNKDWYLEMIDCRNGGAKTGKGASFRTEAQARAKFEAARALEVSEAAAEFLVDLHNPNGDLLDTICIDSVGFRLIIGAEPRSAAYYTGADAAYWFRERSARGLGGEA